LFVPPPQKKTPTTVGKYHAAADKATFESATA
jgi:hypothetical protein